MLRRRATKELVLRHLVLLLLVCWTILETRRKLGPSRLMTGVDEHAPTPIHRLILLCRMWSDLREVLGTEIPLSLTDGSD